MSTEFAIHTLVELFIGILLVYGFIHEDKVISLEQNIKRIVKGNFKRIVRKIKGLDISGEPSPFVPYIEHPNCRCSFQPYFESEVDTEC